MGWFLVVLTLVAGCDWVIGLDRNDEPDIDRACAHGGEFATGEPVALTGSWGVEAARFNASQNFAYLALYPWPGDKSMTELYTSPFNTVTKTFTGFSKINGISFGSYDSYPTVTPDNNHIVFASSRSTSSLAIWTATSKNGSFDMPTIAKLPLPAGQPYANEPYMLADGRTLYFAAGTASSWRLYKTVGDAPNFGAGSPIAMDVTTTGYDLAPIVTDDELELFFSSNRADTSNSRALDIYTATRATPSEPFGNIRPLTSVSTVGIDWPAWISQTGCELYYINKPYAGTEGQATLFVARRPPP